MSLTGGMYTFRLAPMKTSVARYAGSMFGSERRPRERRSARRCPRAAGGSRWLSSQATHSARLGTGVPAFGRHFPGARGPAAARIDHRRKAYATLKLAVRTKNIHANQESRPGTCGPKPVSTAPSLNTTASSIPSQIHTSKCCHISHILASIQ